ncbi:hypothetical protein TNCV_3838161 [Trichonephila clavipes]|nr:hypothetical protein TNCV_3838161 [Trichonephila clavipes]
MDQVRLYHQRKSDENVIRVGNSDSSGSRYQESSFEGVQPRSDGSQNCKNSRSGERRKVKGKMTGIKKNQGEGHTTVTNKRKPHVGSSKESLPQMSRRYKTKGEQSCSEEEDTRSTDPTLKIKNASSSLQARVVRRLREDEDSQAARTRRSRGAQQQQRP